MSFTLTLKPAGVPPGPYLAEFIGIEQSSNDHGPCLIWSWKIVDGEHNGQTVTRYTGVSPTPNNACGKMLTALVGGQLAQGQPVDPAQYIGKRYTIIVAVGKQGGGTRVETVVPPQQQ